MRRRVLLILALPLLGGCFTLRPSLSGVTDLLRSSAWEYRQEIDCRPVNQAPSTIATARTEMMNRLGKSRWELVGIEPIPTLPVASGTVPEQCSVFTFKRRVE